MGSKHELAVRQAADQFYDALNAMFTGNIAPMKSVWSHADDVAYMGPGGSIKIGWDKVLRTGRARPRASSAARWCPRTCTSSPATTSR